MKIFNIICSAIIVYSCTNPIAKKDSNNLSVNDTNVVIIKQNQKTYIEENINLDSIKNKIKLSNKKLKVADTIKYVFQLEDVGTEGNEGVAYYLNNSLKKIELNVYTSMWRYQIQYYFSGNKINVIEITYNIFNSTSHKPEKVKEISYTIDFNGKLIGNGDKERIDVFQEFKKAVPFELN